jgi:hypothetical protein
MVEVGIVWQSMNLDPRNRLAGLPAFANGCQSRTVREYLSLTMAVDAGLGGWEVGMSGNLHKAMTITTVHAQLFDVQGV